MFFILHIDKIESRKTTRKLIFVIVQLYWSSFRPCAFIIGRKISSKSPFI